MLRRTFLSSIAGGAAAAGAQAPATGLKLGIDAYSIRALGWKAPQLLEYTASLKVDTVQFSNLHELESLEPAYFAKIKARAAELKVSVELGGGSICPTSTSWKNKKSGGGPVEYLTSALKAAKGIGSPLVKVYVGSSAERQGPEPIEAHIEQTLKVLRTLRPLAQDLGVKIAMENHSGDLLSRELVQLIEAAGKDWVGCCLDSGNPMMTMEDPHTVLEILGPYTITSHLRDCAVFEHPRGAAWQWVALGDGSIDWPRYTARFRQLCPNACFMLENITGRAPRVLPYLEAETWKAFPKHLASDFAAYVAFVKQSRPLMAPMIIADGVPQAPPEYREALKVQQKRDLEKGLEFAKKSLGVGLAWRG